jgi:hypothetical protein
MLHKRERRVEKRCIGAVWDGNLLQERGKFGDYIGSRWGVFLL